MLTWAFGAIILGICIGIGAAIIVEPSGGWEDLRTRLAHGDEP